MLLITTATAIITIITVRISVIYKRPTYISIPCLVTTCNRMLQVVHVLALASIAVPLKELKIFKYKNVIQLHKERTNM
jgi:hypothetical protein